MNKLLSYLVVSLVFPFSLFSQTLPATMIMRAAGPADNLNHYTSGYIAQGKAMTGQKGDLHWKAFIAFDVISVVEDLAQKPEAKLNLAFDWVKSPDDVKAVHIYYVGAMPSANFQDRDMWDMFMTSKGVKVGTVESYELAGLKQRSWAPIDLKGQIPSGDVTPVNRYLVFRAESEPLENPEGNGLVGLSADLTAHSLIVGSDDADASGATGGY
jgi:hypothetical protein